MISAQKQICAYYTGEDITAYISKNTLIPFLFDAVAQKYPATFAPTDYIWSLLRAQPDRYIYTALHKGCDLPLPPDIEAGIEDIAQRDGWNQHAPAEYALPLETWREVVARSQRRVEIKARLSAGEICAINDLVTCNLDIYRFAQDAIAHCADPELLLAWYESIAGVTILDPTCGAGAFLIAMISILEPLYEACLVRMQAMLVNCAVPDETLPGIRLGKTSAVEQNARLPATQEYGSATLARFRAILQEVERSPGRQYFIDQAIIAHNLYGVDIMRETAGECQRQLLRLLCGEIEADVDVEALFACHIRTGNALVGDIWHAEFPEIMQRGGFDVIVGNPPYVAYSKVKEHYQIQGYETQACDNLYAYTLERALTLLRAGGRCGMLVPVSAIASERYQSLSQLLGQYRLWVSSYSNRPGRLFADVEQRLAILLLENTPRPALFASAYQHWYEQERAHLFETLAYTSASRWPLTGMPLKAGTARAEVICARLLRHQGFPLLNSQPGVAPIWVHNGPTYWVRALPFEPNVGHKSQRSRHYMRILVSSQDAALALAAILSSSTFYFFYKMTSNCRDLGRKGLQRFPLGTLQPERTERLTNLGRKLAEHLQATALRCSRQYPSGIIEYEEYHPARAKAILDEIDGVLAEHYGFTDEELDYIINYEIKYRMG